MTVFSATSTLEGQGQITVTAHEATYQEPPPPEVAAQHPQGAAAVRQEWRTLRFNEETRQSVARLWVCQHEDGRECVHAQADCLAMEYLKSMASAGQSPDRHLHPTAGCRPSRAPYPKPLSSACKYQTPTFISWCRPNRLQVVLKDMCHVHEEFPTHP